ncbi:MAG: hypothetical protein U0821_18780 [Chloroflexota bacterium]
MTEILELPQDQIPARLAALRDQLAAARAMEARCRAELQKAAEEIDAKHAATITAMGLAAAATLEAEQEIRRLGLEIPKEQLPEGIGARSKDRYEYSGPQALVWAVDHRLFPLLRLDTRRYEQLLKGGMLSGDIGGPPGEVLPGREITIATDLSRFVPPAADEAVAHA